MTSKPFQFWFDFASTYSHIAAQTIEDRIRDKGLRIEWRPFLLGPIFKMQGWTDSPFNQQKTKGEYMWRDLERESTRLGIQFRKPTQFPRFSLLAARVATAAEGMSWQGDFIREVFLENFVHDRDIADSEILREALVRAGCEDPGAMLEAANEQPNKERLKARTDEAIALGIFGAPGFIVDGELFWGSDRLDQAIAWGNAH